MGVVGKIWWRSRSGSGLGQGRGRKLVLLGKSRKYQGEAEPEGAGLEMTPGPRPRGGRGGRPRLFLVPQQPLQPLGLSRGLARLAPSPQPGATLGFSASVEDTADSPRGFCGDIPAVGGPFSEWPVGGGSCSGASGVLPRECDSGLWVWGRSFPLHGLRRLRNVLASRILPLQLLWVARQLVAFRPPRRPQSQSHV